VTVVHHYGVALQDPELSRARAVAREIKARKDDVVVLPFSLDRLVIADLVYRIGTRPTVYLVRDDGPAIACFRLAPLVEMPIETSELQRALHAGTLVLIDPAISAHSRQQLGI
jgi:hypothetical protein